MRYQDQVVLMTQRAVETLFRTARAVPADKLTWKPLDNGRTALDQLQECAQVPLFFKTILEQKKAPEGVDEKYFEEARKRRQQWNTLEECERKCLDHSKQLCDVIAKLSDQDLQAKVKLPFAGGVGRGTHAGGSGHVALHQHVLPHRADQLHPDLVRGLQIALSACFRPRCAPRRGDEG